MLAILPHKISQSYGINIPDANYELLLRHRAILFGIIGGFMIYAAISKQHYHLSFVMGMTSMLSFVFLYNLIDGSINDALKKVMKIDVFGIVLLFIGYIFLNFL